MSKSSNPYRQKCIGFSAKYLKSAIWMSSFQMICHCGLALSWSRISPIWLSVNIIIKSSRSTLLCGRVFNARHSANFFDKFLVRLFIMSSYHLPTSGKNFWNYRYNIQGSICWHYPFLNRLLSLKFWSSPKSFLCTKQTDAVLSHCWSTIVSRPCRRGEGAA